MNVKSVALALVAASIAIAQSVSANQEQHWNFKVFLGDRAIGYHDFRLTPLGKDERELQSTAHFDVKFLFFTAYKYRHRDTELWRGECLQRIDAQTNDNGQNYTVRGARVGQEFEVDGPKTDLSTRGCVKTFAYWDPSILKARQLLNSQTGELVDVEVESLGQETIQVRGEPVRANHFRLKSEQGDIDLWYAVDGDRWLALKSKTDNGHTISYRIN